MENKPFFALLEELKGVNMPEKRLLRKMEKVDYLEDPIFSADDLLKLAKQVGIRAYDIQTALDQEIVREIPEMPPNSGFSKTNIWVFQYQDASEIKKRLSSVRFPFNYEVIEEDQGICSEETMN